MFFSPPLAGCSAASSFCWGPKGLRDMTGALCSLKLRRVCLFLTLPKPGVSFAPNTARATRLEKLQPKHNYTLVLIRGVYLCVGVCALCFLKLDVYKSPLVRGAGGGHGWGKSEEGRRMVRAVKSLFFSSSLLAKLVRFKSLAAARGA